MKKKQESNLLTSKERIANNKSVSNKKLVSLLHKMSYADLGDYLLTNKHFSKDNIVIIKQFIIEHLDNPNRLFVSDLIDFSIIYNIELPYKKCIDFLNKYGGDDDYVQMSSIDYLFYNLKCSFFPIIIKRMIQITSNPKSHVASRIRSAFFLYRHTHRERFLLDLVSFVKRDSYYEDLLMNLLSVEYNSIEFFPDSKRILELIGRKYQIQYHQQ